MNRAPAIKGGRLDAAYRPTRVLTLLISDVASADPMNIASGPAITDSTTCADALAILHLRATSGSQGVRERAPGRHQARRRALLAQAELRLIATLQVALHCLPIA